MALLHEPAGCIAAQVGGCGAGRSTERPVLSEEEIERNVQGIKRILEQLIVSGNAARPAPLILNNLVSQQRHCSQAQACIALNAARLQLLPWRLLQCSEQPVLTHEGAIRPMMPSRGAQSVGARSCCRE